MAPVIFTRVNVIFGTISLFSFRRITEKSAIKLRVTVPSYLAPVACHVKAPFVICCVVKYPLKFTKTLALAKVSVLKSGTVSTLYALILPGAKKDKLLLLNNRKSEPTTLLVVRGSE